jgi:hypothetical protein
LRICGLGSTCAARSHKNDPGFGLLPTEVDSICLVLAEYSTASKAALLLAGHRWSVPSSRILAISCASASLLALYRGHVILISFADAGSRCTLATEDPIQKHNLEPLVVISQNDAEKTSNDSFHTAKSTISCASPQPQPPRRRKHASKEKEGGEGKKVGGICHLPPKENNTTCTGTLVDVHE